MFHSETSYNAAYLCNGPGSRERYEHNSQSEILCVVDSATALFFRHVCKLFGLLLIAMYV